MRRKTDNQSDRMLNAAGRVFGGRPFHEVRMEDIANEAQVGKGTLYRYFISKDELYLRLLERAADQYSREIKATADKSQSAYNRLISLTKNSLDFFFSHPRLLELIQRAEVERGSGTDSPWHEVRYEFITTVTELFREGESSGEFDVNDPQLAALMLGGGMRAILLYGKLGNSADLAEKTVSSLVRLTRSK